MIAKRQILGIGAFPRHDDGQIQGPMGESWHEGAKKDSLSGRHALSPYQKNNPTAVAVTLSAEEKAVPSCSLSFDHDGTGYAFNSTGSAVLPAGWESGLQQYQSIPAVLPCSLRLAL